jgi:DivIVA domain-containing protein
VDEKRTVITPAELRNSEFGRKIRGLDPSQVDEVLRLAADSLERSFSMIDALRAEVKGLRDRIAGYERMESALKDALTAAQNSADEMKKNAAREAHLMRREAENEAARELETHRSRINEVRADIERLRNLRREYLVQLKSLVGGHQEILASLSHEFDSSEMVQRGASHEQRS